MKRVLKCALVALLLTLCACVAFWYWPFNGFITPANCDHVQPGMTRTEVYEILGGPGWVHDCRTFVPPGEHPEYWTGLVWNACVDFDDNGRVIRIDHGSRFK